MGCLMEFMNNWKHNTKQNGMVFGVLNNMECKVDLKCSTEGDEMETGCRGNWNEMRNRIWT